MDNYTITHTKKGYNLLDQTGKPIQLATEKPAKNLTLEQLALTTTELYKRQPTTTNNNPDKQPETRGINLTAKNGIPNEAYAIIYMTRYLNTIIEDRDKKDEYIKNLEQRMKQAKKLLK